MNFGKKNSTVLKSLYCSRQYERRTVSSSNETNIINYMLIIKKFNFINLANQYASCPMSYNFQTDANDKPETIHIRFMCINFNSKLFFFGVCAYFWRSKRGKSTCNIVGKYTAYSLTILSLCLCFSFASFSFPYSTYLLSISLKDYVIWGTYITFINFYYKFFSITFGNFSITATQTHKRKIAVLLFCVWASSSCLPMRWLCMWADTIALLPW